MTWPVEGAGHPPWALSCLVRGWDHSPELAARACCPLDIAESNSCILTAFLCQVSKWGGGAYDYESRSLTWWGRNRGHIGREKADGLLSGRQGCAQRAALRTQPFGTVSQRATLHLDLGLQDQPSAQPGPLWLPCPPCPGKSGFFPSLHWPSTACSLRRPIPPVCPFSLHLPVLTPPLSPGSHVAQAELRLAIHLRMTLNF